MPPAAPPAESDAAPRAAARPPAHRAAAAPRRGPWAFTLAVIVGVAVWFAPGVLLNGPTAGDRLAALLPGLPGTVTAEAAGSGWLRPVVLRDVTWADADGRVLLTAAAVRTDRTLLELARGGLHGGAAVEFGTVTLVRPHLAAVVRAGGSDWEDALAPLLAGGGDPPPRFTLAVQGGTAEVTSPGGKLVARDIAGSIAFRGDAPPAVDLAAQIGDGERHGRVTVGRGGAGESTGTDRRPVALTDLPLTALVPLIDRFGTGWTPAGRVTGAGTVGPTAAGGGAVRIDGKLTGSGVSLRRADWPAADRLTLGDAELGVGLELADTVRIDGLRIVGDPGRLTVSGREDAGGAGGMSADLWATLDLAELARQFPATLRLRDGLRPGGGTLEVKGRVRPDGELGGAVRVSDLSATVGGRTVRWERPVSAAAELRRTPDGPRVERLRVTSDFLDVTGTAAGGDDAGAAGRFTAAVRCDLGRLREAAGRFADLDGVTLAGVAEGGLSVSAAGPGRLATAVEGTVRDFAFATATCPGWRERELKVTGGAALTLPQNRGVATGRLSAGALRLDAATVELAADGDTLRAALLGGWDPRDPLAPLLADVSLTGDAARWLDRACPLAGTPAGGGGLLAGHTVRGRADGTARVTLTGPLVAVDDLDLTVTPAGHPRPAGEFVRAVRGVDRRCAGGPAARHRPLPVPHLEEPVAGRAGRRPATAARSIRHP